MLAANPSRFWRNAEVSLLKQNWSKYFKGKILDLGCGEGEIARQVFHKKIDWGLDNDQAMVNQAEKSGIYKKVLFNDARQIDLPAGINDLVFTNSVIEHIKEIGRVLPEVRRVLKPGGWFIATMPSDQLGNYLGWGKLYSWWFNRKYQHYNLYNKEQWQEKLAKAGLKLVDSYYYLDKQTIKQWHKLLWCYKLGINLNYKKITPKRLSLGGAIAVLAKKI